MKTTHIVIMAGGTGSRLYPLSTPEHPKQFIDLLDCGKTLIQLTYERFLEVDKDACFWVVTSSDYVHFIHEQLPMIADEQILAEPAARNTAPCIAYACRKILKKYPEAQVIVTPADAFVPDKPAFAATMRTALDFSAAHRSIICTGIKPDSPHTGYGYIKLSGDCAEHEVAEVESFTEKPCEQKAREYLADGHYYWNAGIFVCRAAVFEDELRRHAPQISGIMDRIEDSLYSSREEAVLAEFFPQCDKISIDYAVMEKSDCIYMVPGLWEWSDLGSFEAIEKIIKKKVK